MLKTIIHRLCHFMLFMFLPHRGRVCHLTSEHSSYLWLYQRTPGLNPARVRFSITYKIVYSVPHALSINVPSSSFFPAYRPTTQRTAWRGISWLRGSWRLRVQEWSCSQPKAEPQILTEEKSAVARSMRRASRASTLVAHWYRDNTCTRLFYPKAKCCSLDFD